MQMTVRTLSNYSTVIFKKKELYTINSWLQYVLFIISFSVKNYNDSFSKETDISE